MKTKQEDQKRYYKHFYSTKQKKRQINESEIMNKYIMDENENGCNYKVYH